MALLDFLKKQDRNATLMPSGKALNVPAGEKLLNAALDAGIDWPHDCRVGSCGKCRCKLKEGKIKPLADFSYTLDHEDIQSGTILACQSQLKTDVVVEVAIGDGHTTVETATGTISSMHALTHDIIELEIELSARAFKGAKAGQYLELANDVISSPRSYSLARQPNPQGIERATFAIRHVPGGEFTDWLFESNRIGCKVSLKGPFGDFYLREPQQSRMLCIAGGSGLAPIIALVEQGIADKLNNECIVLFGARTQSDLYYIDMLHTLGAKWQGEFRLIPVLSDEAADSDWAGARGLVTTAISDVMADVTAEAGLAHDQAYMCGPPGMIDAAIVALEKLGMPASAIHFDKFLDASSMPAGRD